MNANGDGASVAQKFPPVVDLNIGGHHFTTLLQTLTKETGSLLAEMFSGQETPIRDEHGRYFIDADGPIFAHILNFLRVGQLPPAEVAPDVCGLAEYFGIQSLVVKLQEQTTTPLKQEAETSPKAASKVRKHSLETPATKVQKTSSDFSAISSRSSTSSDGDEKHSVVQEENKTNLIVNYLPQSMSDAGFSALFIPMGPIKTMKICRDKGGKSYGFGFVDYRDPEDAERAIQELNGRQIMNKKIKVAYVQKRDTGSKEARICVKNLPEKYTAPELKALFADCGNIIHAGVQRHSDPKELTGVVGFVAFESNDDVEKAIEMMNGKIMPESGTGLVVTKAEELKTKPTWKHVNLGPGIMGKAPAPLTGGRMMGNTPSQVMRNTPGGMMGNNPRQMMENRPGQMTPHGLRPMMGNRPGTLMTNSMRSPMQNMGAERMNVRPGLMGQGPRQMMGNRQGNMNNTMMGHMEGFGPDSMRNIDHSPMSMQQSPVFGQNQGFNTNNHYNQADIGMNRPGMPKSLTSLGCCLYVNNLGHECDQNDLYRLFAPYGALIKVAVMKDKDSGVCKGYAFVTFMNTEEADAAILNLNGFSFKGRPLQVSYKK